MKATLANLAVGLSLLLGVGVCVLAVRGRSGTDRASWTYFRYMPDKSVRSNEVHLGSDHRHIWLDFGWGHAEPFDGQLVRGYHVNADQSGCRPRLVSYHQPYDGLTRWVIDNSTAGFPVSGHFSTRTKEEDGDDSCWLHVSVAHWLLALLLFVPPAWKAHRLRKARGARTVPAPH